MSTVDTRSQTLRLRTWHHAATYALMIILAVYMYKAFGLTLPVSALVASVAVSAIEVTMMRLRNWWTPTVLLVHLRGRLVDIAVLTGSVTALNYLPAIQSFFEKR